MAAKSLALLVGSLTLLGLIGALLWGPIGRPGSPPYSPADVVYGQPLHVTHAVDGALAPAGTPAAVVSEQSKPQLEAPQTFYDFGWVGGDQVVSRVFELANHGSAPLAITAAHTTCACTSADLTASEIPPGKIVLLTVHFDAGYHNLSGQTIRRGVIFETNDPQNPRVDFWIQASVR
jgi:hypothetical protein